MFKIYFKLLEALPMMDDALFTSLIIATHLCNNSDTLQPPLMYLSLELCQNIFNRTNPTV